MNMKYAEDHQFANYGIGGHYGQHMDWFYPTAVSWGTLVAICDIIDYISYLSV